MSERQLDIVTSFCFKPGTSERLIKYQACGPSGHTLDKNFLRIRLGSDSDLSGEVELQVWEKDLCTTLFDRFGVPLERPVSQRSYSMRRESYR